MNSLFRNIFPIIRHRSPRLLSSSLFISPQQQHSFFTSSTTLRSPVTINSSSPITIKSTTPTAARRKSEYSPSMAQWYRVKEQHPGFIILFQLGDFFELFFHDAVKASALLGITLTKRRSRQVVSFINLLCISFSLIIWSNER